MSRPGPYSPLSLGRSSSTWPGWVVRRQGSVWTGHWLGEGCIGEMRRHIQWIPCLPKWSTPLITIAYTLSGLPITTKKLYILRQYMAWSSESMIVIILQRVTFGTFETFNGICIWVRQLQSSIGHFTWPQVTPVSLGISLFVEEIVYITILEISNLSAINFFIINIWPTVITTENMTKRIFGVQVAALKNGESK